MTPLVLKALGVIADRGGYVMDTEISILIYITYAYLYCLQLLLVTLYSAFMGSDRLMIIE